ncbi:autophagy-related protein 13 homolog, partial [Copidosoma floridanum]|uniref:autophagy-related protein 13 homolog n=1 Tax=Copidosoma floridanum TaxID=29053 RepID=UPI000C6F4E3C
CLGENYKQIKVGQLRTPIGMIHLSVSYRTKMTISPTRTGRDLIMLKSDHFHSDLCSEYTRDQESFKLLTNTKKVGAFVDNKQILLNEENECDLPLSLLLTPQKTLKSFLPSELKNTSQKQMDSSNRDEQTFNILERRYYSQDESKKSSCSTISANDDFILVDLKTPFAATYTKSDVGTFYRECQCAPQLHVYIAEQTVAEQLGDLTKQLEAFEVDMHVYEDLLKSLCKLKHVN